MNWAVVVIGFAILVFVLQTLLHPLLGFAIAIAAAFCVFFYVLDKRAIGIKCPHPRCGKYIETNTPWICGFKQCKNEQVDDFPFIYRCQHCGAEPRAYQCHHCGELIFFTKDQLKINYAKCVNISAASKPPRLKKDKDATKIAELDKGIQRTEREVKKAKLELELKGVKEYLEPAKEMTQEEILAKSAQEFVDRNMSGPKIVERMKAQNAEVFKDNPEELKKQNLLVDQWATNHLDLM